MEIPKKLGLRLVKRTILSHDSYLFKFKYLKTHTDNKVTNFSYDTLVPDVDPVWHIKLG